MLFTELPSSAGKVISPVVKSHVPVEGMVPRMAGFICRIASNDMLGPAVISSFSRLILCWRVRLMALFVAACETSAHIRSAAVNAALSLWSSGRVTTLLTVSIYG